MRTSNFQIMNSVISMPNIVAGELSTLAPFVFPVGMASATSAPSFFGYLRILFGVFMAVVAMRFASLSCSVRNSAKSEPWREYSLTGVENFSKRKAGRCSLDDSVSFEAAQVGQIDGLMGNSINHEKPGYSPVSLLLLLCCPLAIAWFVISVIVKPLNGVFRRAFSHIRNKAFKGFPPVANGNTTSAIVRPRLARWIAAPVKHSSPNIVKRVPGWGLHFLLLLNLYMPSLAWVETGREA
jgi:hypothetical protein